MEAQLPPGFAPTYGVELLFDQPPQVTKQALLDSLRKQCGRVDPLGPIEQSDLLAFLHLDHPVTYKDGSVPAQTFITISNQPLSMEVLEPSLQQTWDWPQAREAVARHRATMMVTDMLSSGLDYKERLDLFHCALVAVLDLVSPLAIYWMRSQRLADPTEYLAGRRSARPDPLGPALNVRLFNVEGSAGETVMDTLGLAALGLPDVQCHFTGLDVKDMAGTLYSIGYYLFEKGDVINDGETVQGINPTDKWRCQHEMALVEPDRVVLDVNPGPRHAAGQRDRKRVH